ncbi:MAG: PDZ domain-containing protein [Gemmatimonadetes bacterium]|nr:PDZ domain-containing protein [Gemmatimonadota bacterium]
MTKTRSLLIALALLGALAPRLHAQQGMIVFDSPRRAWLGFSYERTETARPGERVLTLGVVSVVDASPAAKAGLKKGDTILRINNLGASEQLLASLGSSLTPGDTVTFHIRRDGREQDLQLVATKPPADYENRMIIRVRPDSVRKLAQIFEDSMRRNKDTTVFKYLAADSALHLYKLQLDSLRPLTDSTFREFRLQLDSLGPAMAKARIELFNSRAGMDSLRWKQLRGDSIAFFGPDHAETMVFAGRAPGDVAVRSYVVGLRAVAGAELQELNPELARYFRVTDGLLVVNAAPGSPARTAGLQAGDVITGVAGTGVTTILQLRRAIERARTKTVKLEVVRQGAKQTIDLPK